MLSFKEASQVIAHKEYRNMEERLIALRYHYDRNDIKDRDLSLSAEEEAWYRDRMWIDVPEDTPKPYVLLDVFGFKLWRLEEDVMF